MARDWSEEATLTALEDRLARLAPENIAPIPIAACKELVDGTPYWTVDVHVRIPRVTEYEVSGTDKTLAGALRRAYLALNNEPNVREKANASNRRFAVEV